MKWTDELASVVKEGIVNLRADKREVFSASSAGHCVRQLFYKEIGTEMDNPAGPELDMCGEVGTNMHEYIRKFLLMQPGISLTLCETLLELKLGDHSLKGHCDGVILWGRKKIFMDIKTMSPYAYKQAVAGKIRHAYMVQMAVYRQAILNAGHLKPTNYVFWVVNRHTMEQSVVEIRLTDSEWDGLVEEVYHKLKTYNEALTNYHFDEADKAGWEPAPIPHDEKTGKLEWDCAICPFLNTCWEAQGEKVIRTSKWSAKLKEKK